MGNKVILVMDRDRAEVMAARKSGNLEWLRGIAEIRAALDRDPDALVEQIAKALDPDAFSDEGLLVHRLVARDRAETALAAITGEGK